jgi:hypothetical protein
MNWKLVPACVVDVTEHLNDLNVKVLWNKEFSNVCVVECETLLDGTSALGNANKKMKIQYILKTANHLICASQIYSSNATQ